MGGGQSTGIMVPSGRRRSPDKAHLGNVGSGDTSYWPLTPVVPAQVRALAAYIETYREMHTSELMISRILQRVEDPPGQSRGPELRAFRLLLLLHVTVQAWGWVAVPILGVFALPRIGAIAAAILLTACCALSVTRWGRIAAVIALPALLWQHSYLFPGTANHHYLTLGFVLLFALLDPDDAGEGELLGQSLRWVMVVVLFYAGFQKILHGYWFRGEFLAWMISHGLPEWDAAFAWMLPATEVERLNGLSTSGLGSGPYRITYFPFVVFANAVCLLEMALAGMLLLARTRTAAALGSIALVFAIQAAPKELMFALISCQLLLLFVPGNWNRRLLPIFTVVYVYYLAIVLGAPGEFLLKASGRP